MMLFLKNLLLRNFQGCCLLFNYQGSSLFLLIRSSFDILSRRFSLVKNFFIFLFAVCSGFFLPHKSAYLDYHIDFSLSRTFFTLYSFVQRSALASCPTAALGLILFIGLSQRQVVSYHGKSELSMFFLFFIFFAQFRQFNGFFHIKRKKDITSESNVLPLLK